MPELTIDAFLRDGGKIKKERQQKYIWQWYWDTDYEGNWYQAIYHGPPEDWMTPYDED